MADIQFVLAPLGTTGTGSFLALLLGLAGLLVFVLRKNLPRVSRYVSAGILVPLMGIFAWVFYQAHDARLLLSADTLTLKVPFYGFSLPLTDLQLEDVRLIDPGRDAESASIARVNGLALPGYQLGWFILGNERSAFLAVSGREGRVFIPTRRGYGLLLGVADAEGLLAHLASMASAPEQQIGGED